MENKFKMTYSAPTKSERDEIEDIRKNYILAPRNDKLDKLKALDKKAKLTPKLLAWTIGIVSLLVFGLGITMILEWKITLWGVIVSVVGIVPTILTFRFYKCIKAKFTAKYKDEILKLSSELLNEDANKD